jgi:hypothetical protein
MSPAATSTPLITEVTRNETPVVVPTRPLARSLRSSEIDTVTSVCKAIERMLPVITPNIVITMKIHNVKLAGLANVCFGVSS